MTIFNISNRVPGVAIFLVIIVISFTGTTTPADRQYADTGKDPLQWDTRPHSVFSSEIFMSVKPVPGHRDAEYNFECIDGDAPGSGWQRSNEYRVSGLQSESRHTFVARVRDPETGEELFPAAPAITVTTRGVENHGHMRYVPEIDRAFANGEIELIPIRVTGNKDNRIFLTSMQYGGREYLPTGGEQE